MPATWIDFRELRSKARIEEVLRAYSIELKVKGVRASGFCPLPGHQGERKSPSFSVHLTKGLFNCFSCKRGGNAIDLVALLERLDPNNPADIRKAALKLASICGIAGAERPAEDHKRNAHANIPAGQFEAPQANESSAKPEAEQVLVNPPLDFELQKLDSAHEYFSRRGLEASTIAHFGLGFCSRGMLADRIAIPLHDSDDRLIGYAGRLVDDAKVDGDHPKYLFPGERLKDGVRRVFAKSRFLYNGNRLKAGLPHLVIVEGFASVWWLWQHGITEVAALMGSDCSSEQAMAIVQRVADAGTVVTILDGDSAGVQGTEKLLMQISVHRAVRRLPLSDKQQPTDLNVGELKQLMSKFL